MSEAVSNDCLQKKKEETSYYERNYRTASTPVGDRERARIADLFIRVGDRSFLRSQDLSRPAAA